MIIKLESNSIQSVVSDLKFRTWASGMAFLGAICLGWSVLADTAFDAPGNFNPIVPGYFADPTLKKFGDTFYLYATTDGNGGGRGPATVWVSKDFVNWALVPMNWPTTPFYWAPDVVKRPDGRYYLYYNQPCNTFAGVSDSPLGPWTPLTPGDGLVIKDRLVKDVITLDTQLFEDKDGTLYGYWGTWGIFPNSGCGFGVFNPDMKSFARLGMIPNTQAKDFFEAPFMIERNGVYYFTYSSGSCHDASYRVQYAVGSKPDGEFKMGPNNPILATSGDNTVHGPGHHSILQQGDDYFIVYHRHDLPVTPNGMHRQTCVDRLVFESDGVIKKVEPTHQGIGYLGPKTRSANLAFAQDGHRLLVLPGHVAKARLQAGIRRGRQQRHPLASGGQSHGQLAASGPWCRATRAPDANPVRVRHLVLPVSDRSVAGRPELEDVCRSPPEYPLGQPDGGRWRFGGALPADHRDGNGISGPLWCNLELQGFC